MEKRNDAYRRLKIQEESEIISQKSEDVKEIDKRVSMHAIEMKNLLMKNKFANGRVGYAIAHCQVVEHTPLRFFVMQNSIADNYELPSTIYNAHLVDQSEPYDIEELCLSFPYSDRAKITRHREIEVEFQIEENDKLSKPIKKKVGGFIAQLFQHEIQHFEGDTIYNQSKREKDDKTNNRDQKPKAEKKKIKPKPVVKKKGNAKDDRGANK
jgi:peptide deformylase